MIHGANSDRQINGDVLWRRATLRQRIEDRAPEILNKCSNYWTWWDLIKKILKTDKMMVPQQQILSSNINFWGFNVKHLHKIEYDFQKYFWYVVPQQKPLAFFIKKYNKFK